MTNSHNHSNGNSGLINGANNSRLVNMAGRFDASALHIQHGLNATKLQSNYRPPAAKLTEFLVSLFTLFHRLKVTDSNLQFIAVRSTKNLDDT